MVYTIEQIKERIVPVAQKYNLPAVYLFGSYARGEATEKSDIDFLVDKTGTSIRGLFALGGLYNDLSEAVNKEISLVTTDALEQKHVKEESPWFIENLNKDKVRIHGES